MKVAIDLSLLHHLLEMVSFAEFEDKEEVVALVESAETQIAESHEKFVILEKDDAKQLAKDFQQIVAHIDEPCEEDYGLLAKLTKLKLIQ